MPAKRSHIRKRKHLYTHRQVRGFKYKNLTILTISIIVSALLFTNDTLHQYLLHLGTLEYAGAFIAGIFFTSVFTIAPASIILFILAESLPIFNVAIVAGIGGMVGDSVLFQYFRSTDFTTEVYELFEKFGSKKLRHLLHMKFLHWLLPVLGAMIVASPLPDEFGITLMGISKLRPIYFLLIVLCLDIFGVFVLLTAFTPFIRP